MAQQYEAVTHALLLYCICISGFHDNIYNGMFGVYRKGIYVPQSNFVFEFTTEVVCETYPQSSGFIVKVKEEGASRELFTK